ncbi:MAG: NPCBM/NEW2 domain-containing protein [Planctomycetota bacterium]|nr:NPCBM/NEW2 domain-containing protein [Planctomycetota bacterium]
MHDHKRCDPKPAQLFGQWGRTFCLACCLLLLVRLLEAQQPATLIPVRGKPEETRLAGCTSQGEWKFERDGKVISLKADEFVRWGHPANSLGGPVLYLADDSRLIADQAFTQLQIEKDEVRFDSKGVGDNQRLPLANVEAIILNPDERGQRRDLWLDSLKSEPSESDIVLLNNGDRLEGTLLTLNQEVLQLLNGAGDTLEIPRDNLSAVLFQSALLERPESLDRLLLIQLADGSSLRAASWKGNSGNILVQTAGGADALTFEIPWSEKEVFLRKSIVGLLPIGFGTIFLSDVAASHYQHQPYLSLAWPYRRDRNVMGERLQTKNRLYEKGIGMHADAKLTFELEQPFQRFEGAVGIDDSAVGQGSVRFVVEVRQADGPWQTAFTSRVLSGGASPEFFSIDLQGVDAIRLKTDHATDGAVFDRANWLDARLQKSKQ